jgi:hypothetical protein
MPDPTRRPAVFTHDSSQLRGGREDVVTTLNSIEATVSQFTMFVTAGVTDRFDISMAFPVVATNPLTHFFRQSNGTVGSRRVFTAVGQASGVGDLTVRMKGRVKERHSMGVSLGLDVRLPTGDEMNLLGTGAAGLQPFVIVSTTYQKLSPHVNAGYQWNGSSLLAGNPAAGTSADFPDQSVYPNIAFSRQSFNEVSGAVGLKINMLERLLVDANPLFALDEHGVRDKVTPLIGFEYSF